MIILSLTSVLSVGVSFFILFSFIQNKKIHEGNLNFQTIKYLEGKVPLLQEGARWVQEHAGEKAKQQRIDISVAEYKELSNDVFQSIQEEAKKYLSVLIILYLAIDKKVVNIDIVRVYKPQIVKICDGFEKFIETVRDYYEKNEMYTESNKVYIEIDKLKNLV